MSKIDKLMASLLIAMKSIEVLQSAGVNLDKTIAPKHADDIKSVIDITGRITESLFTDHIVDKELTFGSAPRIDQNDLSFDQKPVTTRKKPSPKPKKNSAKATSPK
jgi:hypothetical protein